MTSDTLTNAVKHITLIIACAQHSQQYTKDSAFWLAEKTCVLTLSNFAIFVGTKHHFRLLLHQIPYTAGVGKSYLDVVEDLGGRGVEEHGLQLLTDAQPCPRMLTAHTPESVLRAWVWNKKCSLNYNRHVAIWLMPHPVLE